MEKYSNWNEKCTGEAQRQIWVMGKEPQNLKVDWDSVWVTEGKVMKKNEQILRDL